MPLDSFQYTDDGIFFCREHGRITGEDAAQWARLVKDFADHQRPLPIVTVVDAMQVQYVTTEARKTFGEASQIDGLEMACVASDNSSILQTARVIGFIATERHTHVFDSLDEAWQHARQYIRQRRQQFTNAE